MPVAIDHMYMQSTYFKALAQASWDDRAGIMRQSFAYILDLHDYMDLHKYWISGQKARAHAQGLAGRLSSRSERWQLRRP